MTALATLTGVSYTYPAGPAPALAGVSLEIDAGGSTLLAGPSAGGKSTLLRVFNGLVPQFHGGRMSGHALVAGLDPSRTPSRRMAAVAGMVFQEPESQAVAETVEEEIAFGMEQQGIAPAEMRRRLERLLARLGIEHLRYRRLLTLSGGERQRVAIASVLALEPPLLLLVEPTSQLDPEGAEAVLSTLASLRAAGDLTMVIAEHRLERLLHRVDQVIAVEGGIAEVRSPREAAATLAAVPPVCALGRKLGIEPLPLTVDEAKAALADVPLRAAPAAPRGAGDELVRVEGLTVAYGEHVALRDVELSLREGEVVALVGPNGSGKTTLFRALAGLTHPASGDVLFEGRPAPGPVRERTAFAGMVPQDPALALYQASVREELRETLRLRGRHSPTPGGAMDRWDVAHLAARNPRDISTGQQQRVAIATMLAHEPRAWLLDEPTRGADGAAKAWLAQRLREHAASGGAAIVATHDLESAAHYVTRVVALDRGAVRFDLPVRPALGHGGPFPTQVAQLVPGALTVDEVVA
jgi:energy-coupling factor transport system ATP-binding protein